MFLLSVASTFSFGLVAVLILLVVVLVISNVVVVPQASAFVIERLGAYQGTWQTGIHFKIPLI